MTRASALIDRDPEVRRIASALKIVGPDLQAKICAAVAERVERTLDALGIEPATLAEMHSFVLNMTGIQVVRLENDEDLKRVSVDYAKKLPLLPVQLERTTLTAHDRGLCGPHETQLLRRREPSPRLRRHAL